MGFLYLDKGDFLGREALVLPKIRTGEKAKVGAVNMVVRSVKSESTESGFWCLL